MSQIGATTLVDHPVIEWNVRVVIDDPYGRAVEVSQRAHCANADTAPRRWVIGPLTQRVRNLSTQSSVVVLRSTRNRSS